MARMPEITRNAQLVGLIVGCISVTASAIGAYNWLLDGRAENSPVIKELNVTIEKDRTDRAVKDAEQDQRLDRTDRDRVRQTEATKELTGEMKNLSTAVTRLTTALEQNGVLTKKAEWMAPEITTPTSRPASYEVIR